MPPYQLPLRDVTLRSSSVLSLGKPNRHKLGQTIRLCELLNVLLCLLCPAAIKPGADKVEHYYCSLP
ncbi:Uncharacterized protein HZ326_31494 [Fusarium oxysporum f. sp. albedinis]|nr:Uncharacterized protein HZ326_31494 [Fusarium oxysporum f. sp. albedinis]